MKRTWSLSEFSCLSEYTRLYPIIFSCLLDGGVRQSCLRRWRKTFNQSVFRRRCQSADHRTNRRGHPSLWEGSSLRNCVPLGTSKDPPRRRQSIFVVSGNCCGIRTGIFCDIYVMWVRIFYQISRPATFVSTLLNGGHTCSPDLQQIKKI